MTQYPKLCFFVNKNGYVSNAAKIFFLVATLASIAQADTKIADNSSNFGANANQRTPDGVLEVVGGSATKPTLVIRDLTNDIDIGVTSDVTTPAKLVVKQNGLVGIGSITPQSRLDVAGELKVSTSTVTCNTNASGVIRYQNNNLQYCNGNTWLELQSDVVGDIKHSAASSDHEGWILLDGRAKSTLTATQQTKATTLGIGTNLPNANNRLLMQTGSILATGGASSVTLAQANLPNVNFTGSAASTGAHTHTISRRSNPDNGAFDTGNAHAGESSAMTTDRAVLGTFSTSSNGAHSHTATVSSGGSATAVSIVPAFLDLKTYIYLGS